LLSTGVMANLTATLLVSLSAFAAIVPGAEGPKPRPTDLPAAVAPPPPPATRRAVPPSRPAVASRTRSAKMPC
jgi:hypothetical protein